VLRLGIGAGLTERLRIGVDVLPTFREWRDVVTNGRQRGASLLEALHAQGLRREQLFAKALELSSANALHRDAMAPRRPGRMVWTLSLEVGTGR
jgi:hypothetical protein